MGSSPPAPQSLTMIRQEAQSEPSCSKCKNSQTHMVYLDPRSYDRLGESQLLTCPWTHGVQGGAPLFSGWAFNRDVFCKPKNGNSQSFLSQRTQRKQSKALGLVDRIVQGPFSEAAPLLLLHLGHTCDHHPSRCCQMQTQGSSTPC